MNEHPRRTNDGASDRHERKQDSDQRDAHNDKAGEQRKRKRESNQREKRSYKRTEQTPDNDSTMDMDTACRILGVATDADNETIKKAWHERCKEFHPDFLHCKGVSEEVIKLAERALQKINAAYEYIKEQRCFS